MRTGIVATVETEPDIEIVGEAQNGAEALDLFRLLKPDVSLIDLRMPVLDGLDLIQAIRSDFPSAHLVVLTASFADVAIKKALRLGAAAVLLKHMCRTDLADTIRAVYRGERPMSDEVAGLLARNTIGDVLSAREV